MAAKEELYKRFGPLLLDALVQVMQDELNVLRSKAGFSPRTNQQVVDAIHNKLQSTSPYAWMQNQI
jgi:hypothetical protein